MSKLGHLLVFALKELDRPPKKKNKSRLGLHRELFGNSIFDAINYHKKPNLDVLAQAYADIDEWEHRPKPLTQTQRIHRLEQELGLPPWRKD